MNTENQVKRVRKNPHLRYFEFLKDLKKQIDSKDEVSINDLATKHKIAKGQLMNLIDLKIIKKLSPRKFKWIAKRATLEMAKEIIKYQRDRNFKIKKPIVKIVNPSTEVNKKNYSFSILWGLIKIKKS